MAPCEPVASQQPPRHIRTRRKLWLQNNPSYLEQSNHALTLPLAYDRLIRAYQSPAERQAEGQRQGWARMLEGALVRGEAKRNRAVQDADQSDDAKLEPTQQAEKTISDKSKSKGLKALPEELDVEEDDSQIPPSTGPASGSGTSVATGTEPPSSRWDTSLGMVPADELLVASPEPGYRTINLDKESIVEGISKTQALQRWYELLRVRFVAGEDVDFEDYKQIDSNLELDGWQESQREDEWFDDEAEEWSNDGTERGKKLEGETGIQDF